MNKPSLLKELETNRLHLRAPVSEDAEQILDAFLSPLFPKKLPLGQITSVEGVRRWINLCRQGFLDGRGFSWVSETRTINQVVGQVSLIHRVDEDQLALAFWTHPRYWGRGFATEAGKRVVVFALDVLGADPIWAAAVTWNQASQRDLKKIGFL